MSSKLCFEAKTIEVKTMFVAKTTFDGEDHLRGDQCLHMGFTGMNDGGEFYAIIYAGKPATIYLAPKYVS